MISTPLHTDFYQLTMAQGYWRSNMAEREAAFHLFFRKNPFQGRYVIHCGLATVIEYMQNWRFNAAELAYLGELVDAQGNKIFSADFLAYLADLRLTANLFAMPEGQLVFPHEPVIRVQGPLIQCQLLETALINLTAFASLAATKASRVVAAAQGDPVIEFGLRRAQGPDGALTASRAAYVGGCESTSNTLAAMRYQIPARGTMAHSWVMAFADERSAFEQFAKTSSSMVLLVDTYQTGQGVQNAIAVGKKLRREDRDLIGVRLDSGDLNELSHKTRKLLDEAGFTKTQIMASGDLDEHLIAKLKQQQAPIDIWGVGTRLTTAWDQPALDMAYKLAAIRDEQGVWQYKIKLSDQPSKTTNPGIQQVKRYYAGQRWLKDIIYDTELGVSPDLVPEADRQEDLLLPIFTQGRLVYPQPDLADIQQFCRRQLKAFTDSHCTHYFPHLDPHLNSIKQTLLTPIPSPSQGEG